MKQDKSHFIKEWREARGLNQVQLAQLAGLTKSLISQIERGSTRYSQKSLEALAKALRVEPWVLLGVPPQYFGHLEKNGVSEEEVRQMERAAYSNFMLDQWAKGTFDKK
jgi:transcriptional regulator with XRE-family HTH domain